MIETYFEKEALKCWLLPTILFVAFFDGLHLPYLMSLLAPGFSETIVLVDIVVEDGQPSD